MIRRPQSLAGLSPIQTYQVLSEQWTQLCDQYLPVSPAGSIWRYNRAADPKTRDQGWKIHISATILNANKVLESIGPLLVSSKTQFKAPVSLQEIYNLNSGVHYSYSQIGKIVTIYPGDDRQAIQLANRLHSLTGSFSSPRIPFDNRFRAQSNVYYRYGAFRAMQIVDAGNNSLPAIRDENGNLIVDTYFPGPAHPVWIQDPFKRRRRRSKAAGLPLRDSYRVFAVLSQRGKGGVYQAVDISSETERKCLLKEGRRFGEVWWDGRDGRDRLRNEHRALTVMKKFDVRVPDVYASFQQEDSFFLVTEYFDGENLLSFLQRQTKRLSIARIIHLSTQVARLMATIHEAGWVWGDCKPGNFILSKEDELRAFDFESAMPIGDKKRFAWNTPAFLPSHLKPSDRSPLGDDLYALGVVVYFLTTGRMPEKESSSNGLATYRRVVPERLLKLVSALLTQGKRINVSARDALLQLSALKTV